MEGSWTVTASCLNVSGVVDVSDLGLGCQKARIKGSRVVAGSFTARADGTYLDQTTTSGKDVLSLAEACLNISGTVVRCDRLGPAITAIGYDDVTCAATRDGACSCNASFTQTGSLGVTSYDPLPNGSFTASGSTLTLSDGVNPALSYRYCSSGDELQLVPTSTTRGTIRGTVTLEKL